MSDEPKRMTLVRTLTRAELLAAFGLPGNVDFVVDDVSADGTLVSLIRVTQLRVIGPKEQ